MNIQVNTQMIELARLKTVATRLVNDLVELSDERDTVTTVDGNWIHIDFVGRGSEQFNLQLSDTYSIQTRINYLTDNVKTLSKIKNYILECLVV
ncbi:hypothetical protein [Acinetobacter bereziniae]|uniref:hypothetical protein n=1 Tax=Acinetobacter bereziniae TaxID=106648 RepID=UPI001250935B|nr:hypothetical protein [Acinetobacter bereziniae]